MEHHDKRRAEQREPQKEELLDMLAHELRTPLSAMVQALEVMRRRPLADPGLLRVREVLAAQVWHMHHLVGDMLDLARVRHGQVALRLEVIDLCRVARCAAESVRPLCEARDLHLQLDLPQEAVPVLADETRMQQVLANLLHNAAKYTRPEGQIWLRVERRGADAVLLVRDTGIGIPREMLGQIFDLFTQVGPSLDRSSGGLGLGLALVKRLVALHGGTVSAQSGGPEQGSEFAVHLPLSPGPGTAMEDTPGSSPGPKPGSRQRNGADGLSESRRHVLLVEDNDDIRDTLRELLEMSGHQVDVAEDGPRGLAMALSLRPEAAIIDIGLPGLDGYEVARRIRRAEQEAAHGAPMYLVALTGYGRPEDQRRALQAGFSTHLVKPPRPEQLESLLANLGRR
jgi:CheY-like chemotaxis protein